MPFKKRGPLPRVQHIKNEKKRCGSVMRAFKQLDKMFPRYPPYIKIATSTIKGAGKGVFATCYIPKNTRLGYYKGKCYIPNTEPNTAYLMSISSNGKPYVTIDAKNIKSSNWTRYVNSPESPNHSNVIFKQYGKIMYYVSTRNIAAGDELFVWYGQEYIEDRLEKHFTGFKPKYSRKYSKKEECRYLNH